MKYLSVLLLAPFIAAANTFELSGVPSRFTLVITAESFNYQSEMLQRKLSLSPCSKQHVHALNSTLISLLPENASRDADLSFSVDGIAGAISSGDELGRKLLTMDRTVASLLLAIEKKCSKE